MLSSLSTDTSGGMIMDLIKAVNLNLNNGSKDILTNACFRILEGHKYGLIGANGTGKTTLIRVILGKLEADRGSLILKKNLKTGYVPQQPEYDTDSGIEDFLLEDLSGIMEEMKSLETAMGRPENSDDHDNMEKLLALYQKSCDRFESAGGYEALERSETLIRKLGMDNPMDQKMGTLSGGERSLVFFAKALLVQPELLILDEPGNHLDYLGLAWLESFLAGYPGAVLIVSHNRYLLEKTCTTLLDLDDGKLTEFKGSYTAFKNEKYRSALVEQNAWEASRKIQESLEKRIKELQSIAMSQYNPPASVMSQLGAAKNKLAEEKLRQPEKPRLGEDTLKLDFGDEENRSRIALQVRNFSRSFGDKILFDRGKMDIRSREKVALVGANGCGKSTFLKAVINEGHWDNPDIRIGPSQIVGYLSQVPEFHREALTIEDEIRSWGALTKDGAFSIARNFSFTYQDMEKRLSVLPGGEVNRLQLARLMVHKTNFLILDEPTNHMDIQSRELIEQAVSRFHGTVLVVSHDRYFLDQLVDRVIEIDGGGFRSYEGNFSDYFKVRYPVLPRMKGGIADRGRERKKEISSENNGKVENLERRIEEAEIEKVKLESELKQAFHDKDMKNGRKTSLLIEKLTRRLEKMYSDWEKMA